MRRDEAESRPRGILNLPAADLREALARVRTPDCIIVGVPFDGGSTGVAGARHGPEIARTFTPGIPWRVDRDGAIHGIIDADGSHLLAGRRIVDGGDLTAFPLDPRLPRTTTFHAVASAVERIGRAGSLPILVGGDHSITAPAVRAAAEVCDGLSVVVLDAHADFGDDAPNDLDSLYNANFGSYVSRVDGVSLSVLGVRDPRPDCSCAPAGVTVVTARELRRLPLETVVGLLPPRPTYLSVDVDILDASVFPATGHPVPGGCSVPDLLDLVQAIAAARTIVGFDVVEFIYEAGRNELTGLVIGSLLLELLREVLSAEGRGLCRMHIDGGDGAASR